MPCVPQDLSLGCCSQGRGKGALQGISLFTNLSVPGVPTGEQLRQVSLISLSPQVAERVAAERAESCGNGRSTGYQIRLQR